MGTDPRLTSCGRCGRPSMKDPDPDATFPYLCGGCGEKNGNTCTCPTDYKGKPIP